MTTEIAQRVEHLRASDHTFQEAGIEVTRVAPGEVELQLVIQPHMTNGVGVAHGGWIFLLADTAFAYAAVTQKADVVTTDADIRFHRAAKGGERLIATAHVVEQTLATILVDVVVSKESGKRVASVRGAGRTRPPQPVNK